MTGSVLPFFVGSGRSGTTLFRNIFDAHPELAMTHEAHFVAAMAQHQGRYENNGFDRGAFVDDLYRNTNFVRQGLDRGDVERRLADDQVGSFADAVRSVFGLYADERGKTLFGDKTPGYVNHIDLLSSVFPEARFVHVIRDGRDVALGYLDRDEWGPSTVGHAALYWRSRVSRGQESGHRLGPERYLEARYEDLVDDPEATVRRVCDFLGLDFHDSMLRFHESGAEFIASSNTPDAFGGLAKPITKGMRDWRTQMLPQDIALFEAVAGELLGSLGYQRTTDAPAPGVRVRAALAAGGWQAKRLEAALGPVMRKIRRRIGLGRS